MMLLAVLVAAAIATPSASPAPSGSPRELKTIITVVSSPYCNALAQHFNGALVPMLANDRVLGTVNVQLGEMNDMFKTPDYANRFLDLRTRILKESDTLVRSLYPIRQQIDQLREAAALSNDPAAQGEMRDAAGQLQDAYLHQFQLATDLTGVAHAMMQYDIQAGTHPLNGWTLQEQEMPADEKNIKVYLKFDKQRTSIDTSESNAVDIAYSIAEKRCTKAP